MLSLACLCDITLVRIASCSLIVACGVALRHVEVNRGREVKDLRVWLLLGVLLVRLRWHLPKIAHRLAAETPRTCVGFKDLPCLRERISEVSQGLHAASLSPLAAPEPATLSMRIFRLLLILLILSARLHVDNLAGAAALDDGRLFLFLELLRARACH